MDGDSVAGGGTAVIGHDMRDTSPLLVEAFADGVRARGGNVISIGLASTDLLYFASGDLDLPGAMITASHNPAEYNGIKLCRAGAKPIGYDTGLSKMAEVATAADPHRAARADRFDRAAGRAQPLCRVPPPDRAGTGRATPQGRRRRWQRHAPATRCPRCSPTWTST
ncbi:hypothetical protein [Aeromicrobium sp. UC242_57]|uniref:hypothetical protein n=1 Tax=Aeromicrobium sp. UC242_57 TaxID=3374624 RepID=UPI003792F3C4